MRWNEAFLDELEKLAKGELVVHKDSKPKATIDVKGRVADPKLRRQLKANDRRMRWRARGRALSRGMARGRAALTGPAGRRAIGLGVVAAGAAGVTKYRRDLQREHDDLDIKSSKSRKNYTPSDLGMAARMGGGLYAVRNLAQGVHRHANRMLMEHHHGGALDNKVREHMAKSTKSSFRRAAIGAGIAAGATAVDRFMESRRRKKAQEGMKKKAEKEEKRVNHWKGFKPNFLRMAGRGALEGAAAFTPLYRLANNARTYKGERALRRLSNVAAGVAGFSGSKKSLQNQLEEHVLRSKIKRLKQKNKKDD